MLSLKNCSDVTLSSLNLTKADHAITRMPHHCDKWILEETILLYLQVKRSSVKMLACHSSSACNSYLVFMRDWGRLGELVSPRAVFLLSWNLHKRFLYCQQTVLFTASTAYNGSVQSPTCNDTLHFLLWDIDESETPGFHCCVRCHSCVKVYTFSSLSQAMVKAFATCHCQHYEPCMECTPMVYYRSRTLVTTSSWMWI